MLLTLIEAAKDQQVSALQQMKEKSEDADNDGNEGGDWAVSDR